jgi:hypothetical protein
MPALFTRFSRVATLFLLPLGVGAFWSVLAQVLQRDLPWFALVIALCLLPMPAQLGFVGKPARTLLHALAATCGIVYAQALIVGVVVAGQFGDGVLATLALMGADMTWQLILVRANHSDIAAALIAVIVAALIGARGSVGRIKPRSVP